MLDEQAHTDIINEFISNLPKKDYILDYTPFSSLFTSTGKRDARKKNYTIKVAIRSLRKYDTTTNCRIMSEAYMSCHKAMVAVEDNYDDIIFMSIDLNVDGIMTIKFASASEIALNQLTSKLANNY